MSIIRTPIIDDDGSGTTGTVLDNAWKQELYDQIDALPGSNYSEGTFAPTYYAEAGSAPGYSFVGGRYIKIGRLCQVDGRITITTRGPLTGQVFISGLPFPAAPGTLLAGLQVMYTVPTLMQGSIPYVNLTALAQPGSSLFGLHGWLQNGTFVGTLGTDLVNNLDLMFSGSYQTAG